MLSTSTDVFGRRWINVAECPAELAQSQQRPQAELALIMSAELPSGSLSIQGDANAQPMV